MKQLQSINRLNFDNNHINIKGIFQLAQIGISLISGNEYFPLIRLPEKAFIKFPIKTGLVHKEQPRNTYYIRIFITINN
ncbi:hypothetical protein ACQKMI_01370 [Lysinibacillus sp. NPDC097214]|uniref:hypothetical protein n=1 Tax=Lysinibacillus sp. NPDC097214 TaxID=3390584 RepID=UPI003D028FAC